jgi:hypothetical protein
MQPLPVVENLQILEYHSFSLKPSCKTITVGATPPSNAQKAFAQGVVPAITRTAHRKFNPIMREQPCGTSERCTGYLGHCDPTALLPAGVELKPSRGRFRRRSVVHRVSNELPLRRPCAKREYTFTNAARYNQPSCVQTPVMSPTHFWLGAVAPKSRFSRLGATGWLCWLSVVQTLRLCFFVRQHDTNPHSRISLATFRLEHLIPFCKRLA